MNFTVINVFRPKKNQGKINWKTGKSQGISFFSMSGHPGVVLVTVDLL